MTEMSYMARSLPNWAVGLLFSPASPASDDGTKGSRNASSDAASDSESLSVWGTSGGSPQSDASSGRSAPDSPSTGVPPDRRAWFSARSFLTVSWRDATFCSRVSMYCFLRSRDMAASLQEGRDLLLESLNVLLLALSRHGRALP